MTPLHQRLKGRLRKVWDQLQEIPGRVVVWWERLLGRSQPAPVGQLYRAMVVADDADLPETIPQMSVFIVGLPGNEWLAVMTCPCGCEARLLLNLLPDEMPNWRLTIATDGVVTLSPSVWRTVGCRSHFFLRSGKIQWC
jgi:hypothetical protein